ncbi:MrcB family domain-containing protein [Paenibacillus dendritiformis]|uniref:MrcB family domain-containing protein n=1 Tax=Paenibacillus dendritiformis TaxID=130049 RepID=UPI001BCC5291|nr:DUF3578 domain-containing protein [Paenibacillus dendritiformis]
MTLPVELKGFAARELEEFYQEPHHGWSLRESLQHVMINYLQAKTEQFKGHKLGELVRNSITNGIKTFPFISEQLKVYGSVGQGNWATVPWIAIMDNRVTTSTQRGEYIVYLFSEDMSSVYLTFNQGVTAPKNEKGKSEAYKYLRHKVEKLREYLPLTGMKKDDHIQLASGGLGYDYQVSTVAYYRYDRDQLPDDEQLKADLQNVVENYRQYVEEQMNQEHLTYEDETEEEQEHTEKPLIVADELQRIQGYIRHKGFSYPENLISNFYLSLKTKPFVILAGVSGTGKTKLVKLFAEALGATASNQQFTLIPVRPDWNDPSDLIGYKDLSGSFRPGPLALALEEALKPNNCRKPYFICLDEMNLARVEHYFSDVLSVLETQEWQADRIVTTRLLQPEMLLQEEDRARFSTLHIPDNVYLVGTVNMDETTHPFSKKVLDRANTIEFNYIALDQYPDLEESAELLVEHSVSNVFLRSEYLQLVDVYHEHRESVQLVTEKLVRINQILEPIHAQIGFRIRDSVCFYMIYNKQFGLMSEDEAFDHQLLQKILPRIQGSSMSIKRALLLLMKEALGTDFSIDEHMEDSSPLYLPQDWAQARYPRSARKLGFMLGRLEEDGFTSFWLS